jgi:hypothetical protein
MDLIRPTIHRERDDFSTTNFSLKLRKALNDAERLSPQLCSFAYFRVFRSSQLLVAAEGCAMKFVVNNISAFSSFETPPRDFTCGSASRAGFTSERGTRSTLGPSKLPVINTARDVKGRLSRPEWTVHRSGSYPTNEE